VVVKVKDRKKQKHKVPPFEIPILGEEILWPENSSDWEDTGKDNIVANNYNWREYRDLVYGENSVSSLGIPLDLSNDSYIWCAAGPRGSGKTTYITYIAEQCAYLYKKRIISNYPIKFGVRKKDGHVIYIESEELELGKLLKFDESYRGCIIVLDEAPQVINRLATMTWKNRLLDLWLQLIRKNMNSLLYASQNENWVDNELRWQTDIISHCRDASRRYPHAGYNRGGQILIDLVDNSGNWTGYSQEERPYRKPVRKRLLSQTIWGTFDTFHHNDVFESLTKVKLNVGELQIGEKPERDESYLEHTIPIITQHLEENKVIKRDFYSAVGVSGAVKTELSHRIHASGAVDVGYHGNCLDFTNFSMEDFRKWKRR